MYSSVQFLQEVYASSASPHHPSCHQTSRGRKDGVPLPGNRGVLQKLHGGLETHLLQRRAVGFHANAVEGFIGALKGHVVRDEREVSVVHSYAVHFEHTRYLLECTKQWIIATTNNFVS